MEDAKPNETSGNKKKVSRVNFVPLVKNVVSYLQSSLSENDLMFLWFLCFS